MADPAALELVAKAQVPFYFKTNDKVAWLTRENVNVVAIAHTSVFMENDFNRGASKKAQINLKLLNMDTGETETELGYVLVFPCPVLEIVCDLTQTSGYPLLNVFARLEDFRSGLYVFSCPCDHKFQESKASAAENDGGDIRWVQSSEQREFSVRYKCSVLEGISSLCWTLLVGCYF